MPIYRGLRGSLAARESAFVPTPEDRKYAREMGLCFGDEPRGRFTSATSPPPPMEA